MNTRQQMAIEKYLPKSRVWKEKRVYIKKCRFTSIYQTNKCRQEVYIDLRTGFVSCYTDCPNQPMEWCSSQNERVVASLLPLGRLIRILSDRDGSANVTAEQVAADESAKTRTVMGYTIQWREVRIPINRFGKLAVRNRQFVLPYCGSAYDAPKGLVELSIAGYTELSAHAVRAGGVMLEPYSAPRNYEQIAVDKIQSN